MRKEREAMARQVAHYENKEAISITGTRVLMRELLAELDSTHERVAKLEAGLREISQDDLKSNPVARVLVAKARRTLEMP